MSDNQSVESIRDISVAGTATREHSGIPYVLKPDGYDVQSLEKFLPHPSRKKGSVTLSTLDSFVDYVQEQKQEASRIYANVSDRGASFHAVFDHHEPGKGFANWGEHRASFTCEATVEWTRWMASNKKPFSQVAFCEFLEENAAAILKPPGAEMLELTQTLEGKKNVRFDSTQRLANGTTILKYEEDVILTGAGANKGQIAFPTELELGIAPFKGCSPYRVKARVRHRIEERAMIFRYELIDPHLVIETVATEMIAAIKNTTKLAVFHGNAP